MQESKVLVLLLCILFPAVAIEDGGSFRPSLSLPGCPDKCGDVSIPYPFGIGTHCAATHLSIYFNLTCNTALHQPRPRVVDNTTSVEITDISLKNGEIRLLSPVSHICFNSNTTFTMFTNGYDLQSTPFHPSPSRNRFTVIGCNTLGLIGGYNGASSSQYVTGCYSYCESINSTSDGAPCAGMGCCEAAIPAYLTSIDVMFKIDESRVWHFNPCFYAMVVQAGWYNFSQQDLRDRLGFIKRKAPGGVAPVIADWAIREGSCDGDKSSSDYACKSANSYCIAARNGLGYLCQCSNGYDGNPYILNGCEDVDECMLREQDPKYQELYPCRGGVCQNTRPHYKCICEEGTRSDGTNFGCISDLQNPSSRNNDNRTILLISLPISATVVMAFSCLFAMQLQMKRYKKEKDEYFRQNGGLKLYDEMRSRKVPTIRILTEREIKKATDNYNEDQIIGCGGHGMVYRGALEDHKEVAIKKSKVINDDCREEFVNEIIILSQINHRNIVRLLGCCLDVDVPMLVYEFVSNGTLYEFLHGGDHRRPSIPLDLRLKIATQSAEALAYLHSSTSSTVLHGDVKSANILLDDEHNAKVADFGASALKSMDESEFIMLVQGTLGYLDPESFITHHLTDKSDVYSFGVLLLELMTRKRAMYVDEFNEKKSLAHSFLLMFRQNQHQNMMDPDILEEAVSLVLEKLAKLAAHCLSPSGDDRPTMKEVAERLQILRRLHMRATNGSKNNYNSNNHEVSSSVVVPLEEMTFRSTETSALAWA